ncbi:hypothetical protein FOFC_07827 [Fusarium oxysporum]|nr:hypothetical protein FOFC_07827 [Fusarium oxysporum]
MSAKPGQPGQQQQLEDCLFRHFRGWNWSERARDTSSWLWDFGYDIQRHGLRKWACKDCILGNRPIIATFTSSGLQNAANHLWREHKTPAPEGEKKSTAQLKSEGALKSSQPTIASVLKLDVNKPTEQNIANSFISRFDKQNFQRLLVELIVSSNQSFSFAENPILREIFDYLSPSVSIQHANLTKIGYFTLDNAENNDTAMEVIGAELGFDGRLRRGRCISHTINLSAKALLFGKNANAFEQQLSGAEALSDTEYAQWRKKGPVGKLHNIVVDVRISHRLIYLFKEIQKTGQVTQAKLAKKPRILRDENQLTDKDWEVLYHLEAILTVFETVVKTLEGDGHIRRQYKQLAADFPDPEHFRIGINLAWDKLDEYYQRLDETPIYYTAMALHPAYRWDWFDEMWAHKPSWVEKAKEMVADVWLSDYAHLEVRTSSSRGDDEPPSKRPRFFNPFEKNSRLPNSKPAYAAIIVGDEYQAWQTDREASDGDDLDPLLKSHLESKLDAGCVTLSEDELALAESKWLLEGENSASEVDDSSQQQQIEELVSTSESEAE